MEEVKENEKMLDLLKELGKVQADVMKIKAQHFVRESKDQVQKKVEDLTSQIDSIGKRFGQSTKSTRDAYNSEKSGIKQIIDEYKALLEDINMNFENELGFNMERQSGYQELEQKAIALQKKYTQER